MEHPLLKAPVKSAPVPLAMGRKTRPPYPQTESPPHCTNVKPASDPPLPQYPPPNSRRQEYPHQTIETTCKHTWSPPQLPQEEFRLPPDVNNHPRLPADGPAPLDKNLGTPLEPPGVHIETLPPILCGCQTPSTFASYFSRHPWTNSPAISIYGPPVAVFAVSRVYSSVTTIVTDH